VTIALDQLLTPDIFRPARYLGNELGAKHKEWASAVVRWVLTYPEVYEVGASNLGHIILYNILNAQPRQLCDRTYLPAPDLAQKLKQTKTPLFALESRRCLTDFDILGFSLSYELGATNILEMLDLAAIPLTWRARDSGNYPLIFAGGQTATSNPEPYADFFDFIALGDGEELLPEIGLILEEGKLANLSKEELLLDLAQIPGVYVPRFYDVTPIGAVIPNRDDVPPRILRRVATPIPAYSIGLVPFVETVHDRLVVEIRRGCTRGCRFCQPGMLTRPARDVQPEAVIESIEKGMRATGYNEFSLLSLSCSDYLALPAVGMEIKNVKLYFMIGLPGETDVDVIGIAETLRWLRRECRLPKRKPLDFTLTISNFTPKPHMEDFIGRGDRSLGKVVLRAWQLGAGMDAWWDNTEKAYQAWSQAIEESGLTWKYRQIEQGEWHIFADADKDILERPLPWDHLDTGIDKKWLQEDLKRALDAATVPDCSFEGCSHCGVCSLDFGHNIVIEAPPIPAFAGHFQPNQERAQRIRVWFGKIGEMALVSHLDLVRLFDRVVRRAAIPISFTGGFHPGPRISIANALSLGATSSGEIVDFELTKVMDLERFKQQLSAQLPADLPVYQVEEIPLNAPAATRLLEKAAYLLTFNSEGIDCQQWQNWIEAIKQATVMEREKTTKSGKKVTINLREQLYELELKTVDKQAVLCYVGSCRNDGTLLQPDHIVEMLERVSGQELSLLNFHRQRLILGA